MEYSAREQASLGGEHRFTETELAYIRHALDSEILGLKKCLNYAGMVTDPQAQALFQEHQDIHHRHLDMMISLLGVTGQDITKEAKSLLQSAGAQGGLHHA